MIFGLLFWTYFGYPLSLLILSKIIKNKYDNFNNFYNPFVSIIIPTFNEEIMIEKKLLNCFELDYDSNKLEIIVVDSASSDNTISIVNNLVKKTKKYTVKLIKEKSRNGKASAVNKALEICSGEIILITDANALMNKSALKNLVKHFAISSIGGVEGKYSLKSVSNNLVSGGESLFRKLENWIKEKESNIDSTVGMVGEISCFRRNLVDKLDEKIVAEDFDMSIRIRKKGYRVLHEPNAIIWEYAPNNLRDEIIQKKRRVIGTIKVLIKHYSIIFNPKFGYYGMFIIPSHSVIRLFSPFFLMSFFLFSLTSFYYFNNILIKFLILFEFSIILVEIFNLILKFLKIEINNKVFISIHYFLLSQLIVFLAWFDVLRKKYSVKWEPITSSRGI